MGFLLAAIDILLHRVLHSRVPACGRRSPWVVAGLGFPTRAHEPSSGILDRLPG